MRTELLVALALLCGAEVAYGQYYPANNYYYNNNGYYRGYSPGYSYPYGAYPNNPYPNNPYPNNAYGAQPRAYYYPIPSASSNDQNTTPRFYPAVASGTQNADNAVQPTPIEIVPEMPPPPEEITGQPQPENIRPKLMQRAPDHDGPGRIALGEVLASLCSDPFHRACGERFWVIGDYVQGWMRPGPLTAPVVTSGSQAVNTAVLGQPNTTVLYGNQVNYPTTPGIRLEVGGFVGDGNRVSVDVDGLYYVAARSRFTANSDSNGNPAIGRPFFDANPIFLTEAAELDSLPGQIAGGATVNSISQLWGFEANVRYHFYVCGRLHLDVLSGFRFLRLTESLNVQDEYTALTPAALTFVGTPLPAGSTETDRDSFMTVNQFSGLNLGTRMKWEGDNFFVSLFAKAAFGCTNQTVQIAGSTTAVSGNGVQSAPGGVFALPSNIGTYSKNVFSIVPECGLNFGVDVTPSIRLSAGYSFLYWSQVVRPGAQFDHASNSGQIPVDPNYNPNAGGTAHPTFQFNETSFWVHSITCGIEFHF